MIFCKQCFINLLIITQYSLAFIKSHIVNKLFRPAFGVVYLSSISITIQTCAKDLYKIRIINSVTKKSNKVSDSGKSGHFYSVILKSGI